MTGRIKLVTKLLVDNQYELMDDLNYERSVPNYKLNELNDDINLSTIISSNSQASLHGLLHGDNGINNKTNKTNKGNSKGNTSSNQNNNNNNKNNRSGFISSNSFTNLAKLNIPNSSNKLNDNNIANINSMRNFSPHNNIISKATRLKAERVRIYLDYYYNLLERCIALDNADLDNNLDKDNTNNKQDNQENASNVKLKKHHQRQFHHDGVEGVYNPLQVIRNRKLRKKYHNELKPVRELSFTKQPLIAIIQFSQKSNKKFKWFVELSEKYTDLTWRTSHWNELRKPNADLWINDYSLKDFDKLKEKAKVKDKTKGNDTAANNNNSKKDKDNKEMKKRHKITRKIKHIKRKSKKIDNDQTPTIRRENSNTTDDINMANPIDNNHDNNNLLNVSQQSQLSLSNSPNHNNQLSNDSSSYSLSLASQDNNNHFPRSDKKNSIDFIEFKDEIYDHIDNNSFQNQNFSNNTNDFDNYNNPTTNHLNLSLEKQYHHNKNNNNMNKNDLNNKKNLSTTNSNNNDDNDNDDDMNELNINIPIDEQLQQYWRDTRYILSTISIMSHRRRTHDIVKRNAIMKRNDTVIFNDNKNNIGVNNFGATNIRDNKTVVIDNNDDKIESTKEIIKKYDNELDIAIGKGNKWTSKLLNDYSIRVETLISSSDRILSDINTTLTLKLKLLQENTERYGNFKMLHPHKTTKILYRILEYFIVFILWSIWLLVMILREIRHFVILLLKLVKWTVW